MEALAAYGRGDPSDAMVAAFVRAEAKAHRSELLLRDVLLYGTGAVLSAERQDLTQQWLRRTQRQVDRLPSLWAIAHLRRLEGVVAAAAGDWPRARALIEMALAAFGVAADRCGAAIVQWLYASLAAAFGDVAQPGAATRLREAEAMGLVLPATMVRGVAAYIEHHRQARSQRATAPRSSWAMRLLVPVARLTVRGADHGLLERELLAILDDLFAPRSFRLDEIDASGSTPNAHGSSSEFGDGSGRRLRVSTAGTLDEEERAAMAILAAVTSLALESSQTRSFGTSTPLREDGDDGDFIAVSAATRALRRDVKTLAASSATVVITGESGTGKEVVARALHGASPRAGKPFVAFNCGAVPRDLFEGQLFGHKRGAFTGATSDQIGMLRAAEGGTLFLDEIAELPLDVQPKLLRVLENHEVTPLGTTRPVRVDARIVAATHRDLAALVRAGSFREDLFFRLQVVRLWVPPLRERREDIVPLARHFLAQLSKTPIELSVAAAERLLAYDFPGNVRELRNIVERSLAYAPGAGVLSADALRIGDR
jgi:MoxR-like ATPase